MSGTMTDVLAVAIAEHETRRADLAVRQRRITQALAAVLSWELDRVPSRRETVRRLLAQLDPADRS